MSGFSQVRNTCKHTVTAINVSRFSSVYIYLAYTALATARLLTRAPSSSSSPLLPTVCFSLCQCEMNYATIFFFFSFAYLFNVWVYFIVCCSFCAVTYQKKERCFFNVKKQDAVFLMCKSKVECLNIRKEKIFPPLPK